MRKIFYQSLIIVRRSWLAGWPVKKFIFWGERKKEEGGVVIVLVYIFVTHFHFFDYLVFIAFLRSTDKSKTLSFLPPKMAKIFPTIFF